jgi:formamidopyrimidine-DNA glycosylase
MLRADEIERVLPIRQTAIDGLLHQHIISGVGNLFKSHVCFVTATIPFSKVAALDAEKIRALTATSHRLAKANVPEDSACMIVNDAKRQRRTTQGCGSGSGEEL